MLKIFKPMKHNIIKAALVAAVMALSGCNDAPGSADTTAKTVSVAAISVEAKGFTVGSPMSARTVYVFFDPQCSHCAALWESAKPLKTQAKFIWIPISFGSGASAAQGATLLAAQDPVAAMEAHEVSMRAGQGGISAGSDIETQRAMVTKNTALMNRFGFNAVPVIVAKHALTGELVTQEGTAPTAALATLLGLEVPASQPDLQPK